MYAPAHFAETDEQALASFVRAHPFATLVKNSENGPIAAYAPMVIDRSSDGKHLLHGHLARTNPFWQGDDNETVLAIFAGTDGYVSPNYYPSKREHGKAVPTWNYERVEARGAMRAIESANEIRAIIDAVTAQMENPRQNAWASSDAPSNYIEKLNARDCRHRNQS